MKPVSFFKTGLILLQAILAVAFVFTFNANLYRDISHTKGYVFTIAAVALIVVFSNLKMRYWFPSLPLYLLMVVFWMNGIVFFKLQYFMISLMLTVMLQCIIMVVVSYLERKPKDENFIFRVNYAACFAGDPKKRNNLFNASAKVILPIFIQIALNVASYIVLYLFYRTNRLHNIYFNESFLIVIVVLTVSALLFKMNIRYWILTIGISGIVLSFMCYYNIYLNFNHIVLFRVTTHAQLIAIASYFTIRFFMYFVKIFRAADIPKLIPQNSQYPDSSFKAFYMNCYSRLETAGLDVFHKEIPVTN
jgi:hypothetical protein